MKHEEPRNTVHYELNTENVQVTFGCFSAVRNQLNGVGLAVSDELRHRVPEPMIVSLASNPKVVRKSTVALTNSQYQIQLVLYFRTGNGQLPVTN